MTGGAGFVGATLVRRLVDSGRAVRVLDNLTTGDATHIDGVDVELVEGDIRDARTLDDALAGSSRSCTLRRRARSSCRSRTR